jgi:hypothetical protein
VTEGKQPDILLTYENGTIKVKTAPTLDINSLSQEYKNFLETVTGKPFSDIDIEISPALEEDPYSPLPPFFKKIQAALEANAQGKKVIRLNETFFSQNEITLSAELPEEIFREVARDLSQIFGNKSTKLPAWTAHDQLWDQIREVQRLCGMGGRW